MKRKLILGVLVLDLIALNVLVVFLLFKKSELKEVEEISTPIETAETNCSSDCKSYIDERISLLPTPTPSAKMTTIAKPFPKVKTRSTSYFQVPGSGSTLLQDWTDITGSDFYFDPVEHPGLVDVRFEVNIKLTNGNGQAAVRLYDVTHTMGVVNSEVFTVSQTSVLVTSGAINFWSGRNQYRVQIKSLTADTAVFESGRLKIVSEN